MTFTITDLEHPIYFPVLFHTFTLVLLVLTSLAYMDRISSPAIELIFTEENLKIYMTDLLRVTEYVDLPSIFKMQCFFFHELPCCLENV